jgi:peptide deformylase
VTLGTEIRLLGDPVLRTPTDQVTDFGPDLRRLIDRMDAAMRAADGVGLAANQIGVGLRVFVYDVGDGERGHVVNPDLTVDDDELVVGVEGCLSLPGRHRPTPRHRRVTVRGLDADGRAVEVRGEGLLARCLQHEVDHLDGRLFVDHLAPADRREVLGEI